MKQIPPQIKLYITIAIAMAIFIPLTIGVVMPLTKKIDATTAEFLNTKQQIVNIGEKRNQVAIIEGEFDIIKDSINKIDSALTDQSDFLTALIGLEKIAESAGNRHEISIVEPPKTADALKFLYFRIILSGTFPSIMNFINNLENAQFYSAIEKIEFAKMDKSQLGIRPTAENMKAIIEIKIYTK